MAVWLSCTLPMKDFFFCKSLISNTFQDSTFANSGCSVHSYLFTAVFM